MLLIIDDDETLFASYLCLKYTPRVLICTKSRAQEQWGVFAEERTAETAAAMEILGCDWRQLTFLDTDGASICDPLRDWLELDREFSGEPQIVFAPAFEENGHAQHNAIAEAARVIFGDKIVSYLTYTSNGRSRDGQLNEPDDFDWISLKLRALSCYRSQLRVENCRPWFNELLDIREWLAW